MRVAGIVAEYNPFHNGHAYHIEHTRAENGGRATHVAVVMSGNFVQRGEPALLPKADRVQAALAGGADLVLELPLPWAIASAESFALGAVSLLDALGCVDMLSFGSECGDVVPLEKVVDALDSPRFPGLLRYHLEFGVPFPEARQKAVAELAGGKAAGVLATANNTLGIEYLKALRKLNSSMTPFTVQRLGAGHDEALPIGDTASATAVRRLVEAGRLENAVQYIPAATRHILHDALQKGRCPAQTALLERTVLASLRRLSPAEWAALPGISEGLENRLQDAVKEAVSLDDLYQRVKTRRYALTRLRRIVMAAFLGVPAGWEKERPPYIRVLGVNERGAEILRAAKQASLPVITRVSQFDQLSEQARQVFALECRAADLYGLALPTPLPCGTEFTNKMMR